MCFQVIMQSLKKCFEDLCRFFGYLFGDCQQISILILSEFN